MVGFSSGSSIKPTVDLSALVKDGADANGYPATSLHSHRHLFVLYAA